MTHTTHETGATSQVATAREPRAPQIAYRTAKVDGVDVFYREAGPKDGPRRSGASCSSG